MNWIACTMEGKQSKYLNFALNLVENQSDQWQRTIDKKWKSARSVNKIREEIQNELISIVCFFIYLFIFFLWWRRCSLSRCSTDSFRRLTETDLDSVLLIDCLCLNINRIKYGEWSRRWWRLTCFSCLFSFGPFFQSHCVCFSVPQPAIDHDVRLIYATRSVSIEAMRLCHISVCLILSLVFGIGLHVWRKVTRRR